MTKYQQRLLCQGAQCCVTAPLNGSLSSARGSTSLFRSLGTRFLYGLHDCALELASARRALIALGPWCDWIVGFWPSQSSGFWPCGRFPIRADAWALSRPALSRSSRISDKIVGWIWISSAISGIVIEHHNELGGIASSELEKRPKCQEQLEVFKAKLLQACTAIAVIKVLMTVFDVTRRWQRD